MKTTRECSVGNIRVRSALQIAQAIGWCTLAGALSFGQVPAPTPPPSADRLPPAGVAVSPADRAELERGAAQLANAIASLRKSGAVNASDPAHLADVEIFHKAVDWALRYDEFFDPKQVETARALLKEGQDRAEALRQGRTPWLDAHGLVIRGYRSALDDSVQPYALVVPDDWHRADYRPRRLDVVLAGRNPKRTELAFIAEHQKSPGEIVPPGAVVLHPYGRFCNATKFAGEVDVFEAMAQVQAQYPIDPLRLVVRGFSMGGASTWHLATHHPGIWCAASPGAGFAETALFNRTLEPGRPFRPAWEQTLWKWYDATAYAANLADCPTLAYSGEIDPQKQAADIMETAMAMEGLKLERLIGPQTGHKYHPDSKVALAQWLDTWAAQGRNPDPRSLQFTTYTLRYPGLAWLRIDGLERHWQRADVRAELVDDARLRVTTKNVTALIVERPAVTQVDIDGQRIAVPRTQPGYATTQRITLVRGVDGSWAFGTLPSRTLRKRFGLTGPIDDAFMAPFLYVRGTDTAWNARTGAWAEAELAHAQHQWRSLFRGEAPVKTDRSVTLADIASRNLVLWGDPGSNQLLRRILAQLPLKWDRDRLEFNGRTYAAGTHAPILIFPNPLNPERYVVLNSGMDFRDDGYGTNALQTPKLPDWAVIDLTTAPDHRWPGRVADAGFFNEAWSVPRPATAEIP